jgi:hypothetical protein
MPFEVFTLCLLDIREHQWHVADQLESLWCITISDLLLVAFSDHGLVAGEHLGANMKKYDMLSVAYLPPTVVMIIIRELYSNSYRMGYNPRIVQQ